MNGLKSLDDKYAKSILMLLYESDEPVPITKFLDIASSYYSLKNTIAKMEAEDLVKTEEKILGRKTIFVELTPKGRAVAEKLKEAEKISKIPPEELEKYKRLHVLQHFNVYEDHITLTDISLEGVRYVNIFAKPKGDLLYFWCDVHDDDDCYHIGYLFVDEKLRNFIKVQLNKNGFKLPKKYEKYIEKYW